MSNSVVGTLGVLGVIGLVLLFIALVALGPIMLIWSLNTLFGLGIQVNFNTWIAAWFIALSVRGSSYSKGDR